MRRPQPLQPCAWAAGFRSYLLAMEVLQDSQLKLGVGIHLEQVYQASLRPANRRKY